ncbi:amidohydrolase [Paraburkholderia dipogonis]|uniref:Amidohydrolase n=1 Tax=Paraburkholderia dipogonis TaxID=1211383 RepID=A0A4Y8MV76_9BURK|nr:amidohydrolase family protein [Paraburkholderia dipogonis]TFE41272.1 amidohydrolase [Paraburkholderia dipogonis]
MTLRIDAHQHFWRIASRDGYWPPHTLDAIYRDFGAQDLEPILARSNIQRTVLVQSLPTPEDTRYLLDIACASSVVAAVVGWVDLKSAGASASLATLARQPKFRGVRPMLQDLEDDRWIDDAMVEPAVEAMLEHDLSFDALVTPRHLHALLAFARRYPRLRIVIDHAAKPPIVSSQSEPWRVAMSRLAELPNVHCKLSGLWTEAGPHPDLTLVEPYVRAVCEWFGASRLMWGSDWPVSRLASHFGGYGDWLAWCEQCCDRFLGPEAHASVFGGNACHFYRIDHPSDDRQFQ